MKKTAKFSYSDLRKKTTSFKISEWARNWKIFPFLIAKEKCWFSTKDLRKKLSKISGSERKFSLSKNVGVRCETITDIAEKFGKGLNFELAKKFSVFEL